MTDRYRDDLIKNPDEELLAVETERLTAELIRRYECGLFIMQGDALGGELGPGDTRLRHCIWGCALWCRGAANHLQDIAAANSHQTWDQEAQSDDEDKDAFDIEEGDR